MYMQILWLLVVCICRHNSVSDSAAEGTQTTGYSAVSVVQDPHEANHRFGNHIALDLANLARASFQGPFVPEPCASGASFCQDGELEAKLVRGEGDEPGMEMLPLQANEQETCRILPVLWDTLGAGNRQLALDRRRWSFNALWARPNRVVAEWRSFVIWRVPEDSCFSTSSLTSGGIGASTYAFLSAATSSCCEVDVPVDCTGANAKGEGVSCDGHGADGVDDGGA